MAPRPRLTRIRRTLERKVLDGLLGLTTWVIERRLFAAAGTKGHDEPDRRVTMRL